MTVRQRRAGCFAAATVPAVRVCAGSGWNRVLIGCAAAAAVLVRLRLMGKDGRALTEVYPDAFGSIGGRILLALTAVWTLFALMRTARGAAAAFPEGQTGKLAPWTLLALAAWSGLDAAGGSAAQAQAQYDAVSAALADVQEQPLPTRDLSAYTPASVRAELLRTEMEGASIQSRLDQNRGALAALGDPAALAAEQEQLTARIRALEEQYTAVELAEAAIQDAAAEMQRRFAPALTEETGKLFSALTGGKYDRMLLDRQMDVMAGETAEPALRPGGYLSAGTQDALYLALRLAICALALPEDSNCPLILDDALCDFDGERMARALDLLGEIAKTRQVILFTCQDRERRYLNGEIEK